MKRPTEKYTNESPSWHRVNDIGSHSRSLIVEQAAVADSTAIQSLAVPKTPRVLTRQAVWGIGCVLGLLLIGGCASFDLNKRIPWMDPDQEVKQPTKITALWTHTVLNQQGKRGIRGFGGRLMFHAKDHEKPVKVNGTLTVYAFDATKSQVSSVPERKFAFTAEQFATHYSHSKLGHSYSIWIPWDEVGGAQRRLSLLARFEPEEGGGMILSDDSLQLLPGITPEEENAPYAEKTGGVASGVTQAGYQQESKSNAEIKPPKRLTLTDSEPIDLPPSFSRQMSPEDAIPMRPKSATNRGRGTLPRSEEPLDEESEPGKAAQQNQTSNKTPYDSLKERQRELADRFAQRKSQVQRASSVRSGPSRPQSPLPQRDTPSLRQPSSSPVEPDPFDSDASSDPADSR